MSVSTTITPGMIQAGQDEASAVSSVGLRERKKREKFRAMQSAARRLVWERGLDNVTVDEIADVANTSKRTFFNYFSAKEDAILAPEPGVVERFAAALASRPADETLMQGLWAAIVASWAENAEGLQEVARLVCANPQLVARQVTAFMEYRKVTIEWAIARTGVTRTPTFIPNCWPGSRT